MSVEHYHLGFISYSLIEVPAVRRVLRNVLFPTLGIPVTSKWAPNGGAGVISPWIANKFELEMNQNQLMKRTFSYFENLANVTETVAINGHCISLRMPFLYLLFIVRK